MLGGEGWHGIVRYRALAAGEIIKATCDLDDEDEAVLSGDDDDSDAAVEDVDDSGRSYDRVPIALAAMDGRLYVLDKHAPRARVLV